METQEDRGIIAVFSASKLLRVLSMLGLVVLLFLQTGCSMDIGAGSISSAISDTNVELRNAVDSFDRAIDALSRQSANWQVTLQELKEGLVDDTQSTLRVEITDLMKTGVVASGGEFRCDADFLRIATERKLIRIRNDLAQVINAAAKRTVIDLLPEISPEPFICDAIPAPIDIDLKPDRRTKLDVYGFELKALPIQAEVVDVDVRKNVTNSLGVVSDSHMVLDLTDSSMDFNENSQHIVLSWNGKPQSVIPISSAAPGPICEKVVQLTTPEEQSFIPPHIAGDDKEYKGYGPCIRFNLRLGLDAERKTLTATYSMDAFECSDDFTKPHSNYTRAAGEGTIDLYKVTNPGDSILGFNLDNSMKWEYIDDDTQDDIYTFGGINPVEKLVFVGDTKGPEAGTRTGVTIHFRPIDIDVNRCKRIEGKSRKR